MIIEISVAVIACAFVILVIYLIILIRSLCLSLIQFNQCLSDLKQKGETLSPLLSALNKAGEVLDDQASSLKKNYEQKERAELDERERKSVKALAAVLELAGIGLSVWQKFRRRSS